jgi:hypothetical protein
MLFYLISEIDAIRQPLMMTRIVGGQWGVILDEYLIFYWMIFVGICMLYIVLMFTAIYIGALVAKSLHFMSSLRPKTLKLQYTTSIMVTFIMQIQFAILLLIYNISDCSPDDGFCAATPFFMLLVYSEFIIISILNHFSFSNKDFIVFGREAIKENEVQLFDFLPDYNAIHDLHNYRRIHGEAFLYAVDNDMPYLSASDIDEQSDSSNNGVELRIAGRKNHSAHQCLMRIDMACHCPLRTRMPRHEYADNCANREWHCNLVKNQTIALHSP